MRKILMAAAACAALALSAQGAAAQSFNCNYAKQADEVLICQNPDLGELDEEMASIYSRLMNQGRGYRFESWLRGEQSDWIAERSSCGYDRHCIRRAYRHRIHELRRL